MTDRLSAEKDASPLRLNGYITRPELWALDQACKPIREAFPSFGPYLVGSVMERPTFRDVDVRLILKDKRYDRLSDDQWGLFGFITSRHLAAMTGLPVDFQVQRQSDSQAAYGDKMRTPLGLRGAGHWVGDQRPPARPLPPAVPNVVCPHDPVCRRLDNGWPACVTPPGSDQGADRA